jgi:SAM-dependent methyltransferase
MPTNRVYDLLYRLRMARVLWSSADRWEIRRLVEDGPCAPSRLRPETGRPPRAIDLGCGEGAVSIYLAQRGFETVGIDFSDAALQLARRARARAGLAKSRLRFVRGDLTAASIPGVDGPFDLLVDYGSLDDLSPDGRRLAARLIRTLSRPGSRFFLYAATGQRGQLPRFGYPSRYGPFMVPGETEELFGADWSVERIPREGHRFTWTFLLTRR